ncbi:MAG: hypothetical protein MPJ79_06930 [Alphaproteobacteria bacterium]|nr:hypothetical protein [Alphaproteobacteria bacterium]
MTAAVSWCYYSTEFPDMNLRLRIVIAAVAACGFSVLSAGYAQEADSLRSPRELYRSSASAAPPFILREGERGFTYRLWIGGFRSASFDLVLSPRDERDYSVEVDGWLEGIPDKLVSMDLGASASGVRGEGGAPRPRRYRSRFLWGDKAPREQGIEWLEEDVRLEGRSELPEDYDARLVAEAIDPLSFLGEFFLPVPPDWNDTDDHDALCGGERVVFEGRYLFGLSLLSASVRGQDFGGKYSPYNGRMLRCLFSLEPIYGYDDPDRERQWSREVELWLVVLGEGDMLAPARVSFGTQVGKVLAYLQLAERGPAR